MVQSMSCSHRRKKSAQSCFTHVHALVNACTHRLVQNKHKMHPLCLHKRTCMRTHTHVPIKHRMEFGPCACSIRHTRARIPGKHGAWFAPCTYAAGPPHQPPPVRHACGGVPARFGSWPEGLLRAAGGPCPDGAGGPAAAGCGGW